MCQGASLAVTVSIVRLRCQPLLRSRSVCRVASLGLLNWVTQGPNRSAASCDSRWLPLLTPTRSRVRPAYLLTRTTHSLTRPYTSFTHPLALPIYPFTRTTYSLTYSRKPAIHSLVRPTHSLTYVTHPPTCSCSPPTHSLVRPIHSFIRTAPPLPHAHDPPTHSLVQTTHSLTRMTHQGCFARVVQLGHSGSEPIGPESSKSGAHWGSPRG